MKVLRNVAISYTLIMLFFLSIYFYLNIQFAFQQRDLLYYNDLLHKVQDELTAGESAAMLEKKYDCRIILSKDIHDPELAEQYRNSAFVLDLEQNGEYIGKVCWLDDFNRYDTAQRGFFGMAVMIWALALIGGYLLLFNLYRYFVKPLQEMKSFSEEVAKGNLDMALPVHRHNLFGSFIEAFDIMRERLVEARNAQIESEKARKEMVTALSHDIKTPVSVIKATCEVLEVKMMTELAKDSAADEKTKEEHAEATKDALEKIANITQKADTISLLVNNMMHANLEEIEKLEVKSVEENSLIIKDYLSALKQYGNIIMDNDIPGCLVYMDRLRMEQTIDNVVGNSYKYAGTDIHVSFDVFAVETALDGQKGGEKAEVLRIRIKDSGPGVDEDDLPLISEKYYRGNNAENLPGSGLGFYLVKYYMEKMGGGVEYYNDNGFTVELLLRKV